MLALDPCAGVSNARRIHTGLFLLQPLSSRSGNAAGVLTTILNRPLFSMASRALTTRLMMDVSNWLASACTNTGFTDGTNDCSILEPASVCLRLDLEIICFINDFCIPAKKNEQAATSRPVNTRSEPAC